jgi:hypothetical protein
VPPVAVIVRNSRCKQQDHHTAIVRIEKVVRERTNYVAIAYCDHRPDHESHFIRCTPKGRRVHKLFDNSLLLLDIARDLLSPLRHLLQHLTFAYKLVDLFRDHLGCLDSSYFCHDLIVNVNIVK